MNGGDTLGPSEQLPSSPRILITNTVASNGGDAAILLSICEGLRDHYPDASIRIADSRPDVVSGLYPDLDFVSALFRAARASGRSRMGRRIGSIARKTIWRLMAKLPSAQRDRICEVLPQSIRRALAPFLESDLVISTGGTYLVEAYSLGRRFFEFDIVRDLGRPLVLFTQTFGPFRQAENRFRMRRLLAYAEAVFVRDDASLEAADEIGAETSRIRIAPDVVFMKSTAESLDRLRRRELQNPRKICVSVRDWSSLASSQGEQAMDRYLKALSEFADHVVSSGDIELHFLSTCQGVEGYHYDDSEVARQVVDRMTERTRSSVRILRGFYSPWDIRERLKAFDLLIATRMHMSILGLTAGIPVIPIAYERKIQSLFRQLDYPFHVIDANEITAEQLRRQWKRLPTAWGEWRMQLADHLEAFARQARLPFWEIRDILGEQGFVPKAGGEPAEAGRV